MLDAVQRLRARAQAEGNLKTTAEQKVTVEPVAAAPPASTSQTVVVQQQPASVIKIEPANPQVVYVPSYNPTVVYGAWPYPASPPYYPYPPGYAWGAAALSFGVGMAVGAAVWGNCNWGGGNVDVDVNRNSNFTQEREPHRGRGQPLRPRPGAPVGRQIAVAAQPGESPGVQYRDQRTQERYNRGSNPQARSVARGLPRARRAGAPGTLTRRRGGAGCRARVDTRWRARRRARPGSGRGPGIARRAGGGGL